MKRAIIAIVVVTLATASGCATMSNRSKTLLFMLGAGAVGAAIGSQTAPDGTSPVAEAAFLGGLSAAAAGGAGLFIFDEQKRADDIERQNLILKEELGAYRGGTDGEGGGGELTEQGRVNLEGDLPPDLQDFVHKGRFKHKQYLDRRKNWVVKSDNYMVRECEAFELQPESLRVPGPAPAADVSKQQVFPAVEIPKTGTPAKAVESGQ
jgi:hypothetical protein